MLQNYNQLVSDATNTLYQLYKSGAGFTEYLQAVGYEILVLLVGILILAVIFLIACVPCVITLVIKNYNGSRIEKYNTRIDEYDSFVKEYNNRHHVAGYSGRERTKDFIKWAEKTLTKYQISFPASVNDKKMDDAKKYRDLPHFFYRSDELVKNVHSPEKLGSFADVLDCVKKRDRQNAKAQILCVCLLIVYIILLVPLVLMLI